MILLEFHNPIILETLKARFYKPENEKYDTLDIKIADFDGVLYHLSTGDLRNIVTISLQWKCFGDLKKWGAADFLAKEYAGLVVAPESGYDFSIQVDCDKISGNKDELLNKISLLKRNALAAPFHKAFEAQEKGQTTEIMDIRYRDEEAIFVQAQKDRVTVFFSTTFKDETDVIFGKVFLQEFVDARRQPALQNAPQVLYYPRDPPEELRSVKGLASGDHIGYVTFVLFPRHFDKVRREMCISLIQTFRDYLHYHIKCSKAYMHSRMRARVVALMKILNRAKPDVPVERNKTASGKTFRKF